MENIHLILHSNLIKLLIKSLMEVKMSEFEEFLNELDIIESIANILKLSCEMREFNSVYYDAPLLSKIKLSKERCDYINLLYVLHERILKLKISYNKTPTIAADR